MLKKLIRKISPNPLEVLLKKAQKKEVETVLLFWNRGLGDIALGLFAIVHRIRTCLPNAKITFITRPNLKDGFTLLGGVEVIEVPWLKRGDKVDVYDLLERLNLSHEEFDWIVENPDPTYWVKWQLGKLTPKLHWQERWDCLCEEFPLEPVKEYIGVHLQSETGYASWRDWPLSHFEELFARLSREGKKIILFGFGDQPQFDFPGIVDLRGKTPLFSLLSIIKNRCSALIVPDSGISSMVYYLDSAFPLKHISLWADPNMGILKQNVASPNPQLEQIPLIGKLKEIETITPQMVYDVLV